MRTMRPDGAWSSWCRTGDPRLSTSLPVRPGRFSVSNEAFTVFKWTRPSGYSGRMHDDAGTPPASFDQPSGG
jgi:hypothetical protein